MNGHVDNGEDDGAGLNESHIKPDAKLISISSILLNTKSNYQDFQRFQVVDVEMAADAEATLPALVEAVKQALPASRKAAIEARGQAMKKAWSEARERTRVAASYAWDASPISTARMAMEVYAQIKDLDWSSVGGDRQLSAWPTRLWPVDKHYHHIGGPGGYGVGYGAPAAVGAALANRDAGRFSVNFQPDGDLMFSPGVLWTAARHKIPLLSVMHNNRGYHQETMHVQRMSNRRNRVAFARQGSRAAWHAHRESRYRLRQAREFVGRLFGRPDHQSQGPGAGLEKGGRGGESRRARPGRCRHATAVRTMKKIAALIFAFSLTSHRRLRRLGGKGQGRLHPARLLAMPRHHGAGLGRDQQRQAAGTQSVAVGSVHRFRALDQPRHAAL